MGLPNSGLFLSESDLNAMDFKFLSKPTSEFQDFECQIVPKEVGVELQEQDQQQQDEQKQEEEEEKKEVEFSKPLDIIKMPSLEDFNKKEDDEDNNNDDDDGGFRTPTKLDQRMPLVPQCPPAPRKPKSLPVIKRSKAARRPILIDLSKEIESLFPPALLADLGGKIKKARKLVNGTN